MAELSPEQRAFLAAHGIPLSRVFNAAGLSKPQYQAAMRELGKSFAYNVTPCGRGLHRLRTRAGHCIQCDHAKIAYMLRHDETAYIYIAGTRRGRMIKVGCSGDIDQRRSMLNTYRYGEQSDWQMLAFARCQSAGKVEFLIHDRLAQFSVSGTYVQGGRKRSCYELFRCDFADAKNAMQSVLPNETQLKVSDERRANTAFAFRSNTPFSGATD